MSFSEAVKNPGEWLYRSFLPEKLNNPLGYLLGTVFALFLAAMFALLPLKIALLFVGLMVGIPLIGACFVNLQVGVIVSLIFGFFVIMMGKFVEAPFGIGLDGLLFVMSFSMIVQTSRTKDLSWAKHPISAFTLIWIAYSLVQVINPWAVSKMAWLYTVRSLAGLLFMYFIACFAFSSKKMIFTTMKIILGLGSLASLYALKQEWIGFSAAEEAWLRADPLRFQLIFQWSRMRVFSFFSDPTTYGIMATYMGMMCLVFATGKFKTGYKIIAIISIFAALLGMAYAGSRTPFVLVPAGIFFYMIMILDTKKLVPAIFAAGIGLAALVVLIKMPTSNPVIIRLQSAFYPTQDASVQVRIDNQRLVQPFIQRHPIGAGLGSTGEWGKRFTPDSWLASFAHDSGYVRIAVEAGWIGLLIYMAMIFTIMRYGIYYYFRMKDPQIKSFYLAITCAFFILALANYPQEAIVILPTSLIFYLLLAMLVRLKDFDEEYQAIVRAKNGEV